MRSAVAPIALVLLALATATCRAAGNDNDVEWNGVFSHPAWRVPESPRRAQSFTVDLRVFRGDITGSRVRSWDGRERFHVMRWERNDGPYDVWRGTVAGAQSDFIYYHFEITDGGDTDYYNALGMWADPPQRGDFFVSLTPWGRHPLGATTVGGGAVFRVWAPNAARASVAGSFNGWSGSADPLQRNRGFWEAMVAGARPGDQYKFVFDGELWRTDPRARRQVDSVGNSVIVDPSGYRWGDGDWVTPPVDEMVIYELHVGSFSGEGDGVRHFPGRFRDVVGHLDHLVELGVNMIELMPVGEFAGDRSWGYNPSFQYAPESAYGGPDDLKHLVDQCHRRGIGVLLDVVYNHMGPGDLDGNLNDYDGEEIYFYPRGSGFRETPWGPRPDYGRVEVREYLRDNVRYWLEEYHLDGLRVDATDFIKVNAEGWRLLREIGEEADVVSPRAIIIAEQLPNDLAVTRSRDEGGAGLDAQWNDLFHDNLRRAIGETAFGDPDLGAVAAGIDHFGLPGAQAVNYIESHDEAAHQGRVSVVADRSDPAGVWARGRSAVAAALVLFSSGIPMLLQGQELLESRPFGDAPEHRVQWSNRERNAGFFRFMRDAVHLRRTQSALRASSPQNVFHVNDGAEVLAFHRWTASGDDLVVVVSLANRGFDEYRLGLPLGGEWFEVLNGDAAAYGGSNRGNGGRIVAGGPGLHGLPHSASIVLPGMGVLVFARRPIDGTPPVTFVRGDCNEDGAVDVSDAVRVLGVLFLGEVASECPAACDTNDDDARDISDAIAVLAFLFAGGGAPPQPFPACGDVAGGDCGAFAGCR